MSDITQRRGLLSGGLTDKELQALQKELELKLELKKASRLAERGKLIADINLQFRNNPEIRDMLLRPLQLKRGPKPKRSPGSLSGYQVGRSNKVSSRVTGGLLGPLKIEQPKRGRKKIPQEYKKEIIGAVERKRDELRQHSSKSGYVDAAFALLSEAYEEKHGKEPGWRERRKLEEKARKIAMFIYNHKRNMA